MSTNHENAPGGGAAAAPGTVAHTGGVEPPQRFDNPGLAEHRHRLADVDPKAAKTAERQVALLFLLSMVGTVIFIAGYVLIPLDETFATLQLSNVSLGLGLGLAMFGIGIGAVHWAKTLMPDEEVIEERHAQRGTDSDRAAALEILRQSGEETGIARRPLIRNTLIGAAGLVPLTGVVILRDLGPLPEDVLTHTYWEEGMRLVHDVTGAPIRASDVTIGSAVHVMPEGIGESEHPLEERAKAAVLLMRLHPDELSIAPDREGWDVDGIVAYSKICTHVGCPVALYEQTTHHLLCPCHQSTFDVANHANVVFGPATRPLPQLAISVDDEGYLVAQHDFVEPVGPSYWERG
jgi:ubiquinol-cytochrome c reductase iron-sulfur subunit